MPAAIIKQKDINKLLLLNFPIKMQLMEVTLKINNKQVHELSLITNTISILHTFFMASSKFVKLSA